MSKLLVWWERIRSGYLFVPLVMTAGAAALAVGMLALDNSLEVNWRKQFTFLYAGGPDGARSVVSTIASSMIGVAGTVFSIVIVALTVASSQFGPRILRSFLRDTSDQLVLGTFIGTFVYCLIVLRAIRSVDEGKWVPDLAVFGAIVLALASLIVLIYFINRITGGLQVSQIIREVGEDLREAVEHILPDEKPAGKGHPVAGALAQWPMPMPAGGKVHTLRAHHNGYLCAVDGEKLAEWAAEDDLLVTLAKSPGDYVMSDEPLASVLPAGAGSLSQDGLERLTGGFYFGSERTTQQDIAFPLVQLVQLALRALSPGINDPITANMCINELGEAMTRIAGRPRPNGRWFDGDGKLRVAGPPPSYGEFVTLAFDQIRTNAAGNVEVAAHLLDTLTRLTGQVPFGAEDMRDAIAEQGRRTRVACKQTLDEPWHVRRIEELCDRLQDAVDHPSTEPGSADDRGRGVSGKLS